MNVHRLLVITNSEDRFSALCQKLIASFDFKSFYIDRTKNIATAKIYMATQAVDLIVLDFEGDYLTQLNRLPSEIHAFAPIPIIAWFAVQRAELAQQLLAQGVASCLDDSMTSADLILQILKIIVSCAKSRQLLSQQQKETVITLEAIADAVICTNSRAEVTFLNSAARRLLQRSLEDVVGKQVEDLMTVLDGASRAPMLHPIHQVIATLQSARLPAGSILLRHDGTEIRIQDVCSPIIDDSGALTGIVMVFHDTTEAYEMQTQVDYLAWHDYLTGLPNRFAIQKHLDQTLAHAMTHRQRVPVIYLDLDKFKLVNDTLGHGVGDKLLVSVAERLRACFRLIDMVGRQGGDEFVVVMGPGSSAEDAMLAAARINEALTRPHLLSGSEVRVGCSAGISMFPDHGTTVEEVLQHADVALQSVKIGGRNGWRMFTHELRADALERQDLENRLHLTLKAGRFCLFYQPKIRLSDGKVCGCEALLRWNEPDLGWVPATKLIPCAEASGLIYAVGKWVFDEALRQARVWTEEGLDFGTIAINISAHELRQPDFVDHIGSRLKTSGVDPGMLEIELTESVLMHDIALANQCLRQLKELGVTLAIDDFGTGYSSLSYLADFPIDVLKIDRSFIHGINRAGTRQQALLHAILTLAKSLSLIVVAEGIETVEEEKFLLQTGCQVGQGYYYSMPLDAATFERFVVLSEADK